MIKITPIETGKARMKSAQMTGRDGRGAFGRKVDIFRDTNWVGPLPIYSYLIEHPQGASWSTPATPGGTPSPAICRAGIRSSPSK
jgi:hypothetical protein